MLGGKFVPFKNYVIELLQPLNHGAYAVIYSTSEAQVVCKAIPLNAPIMHRLFQNQTAALKVLKHPNIVNLLYSTKHENYGLVFLEKMERQCIQLMQEGEMGQSKVMQLCREVAQALLYIHEKGFVHRDVKIQNIMLTNGSFKLIDFGSAKRLSNLLALPQDELADDMNDSTTPNYRPPQIIDFRLGYSITSKMDVFALGVTVYSLLFLKVPFQSRSAALSKSFSFPNNQFSQLSLQVINKCLETDPTLRPSALQIHELVKAKEQLNCISKYRKIEETVLQQIKKLHDLSNKLSPVPTPQIDSIQTVWSKLTTETEGWLLSALQNSPESDTDFQKLVAKLKLKPYKATTIISVLNQYDTQNSIFKTLSFLLLLFRLLRHAQISHQIIYKLILRQSSNIQKIKIIKEPLQLNYLRRFCLFLRLRQSFTENFIFINQDFTLSPSKLTTPEINIQFFKHLKRLYSVYKSMIHPELLLRDPFVRKVMLQATQESFTLLSLAVVFLLAYRQFVLQQDGINEIEANESLANELNKMKVVCQDFNKSTQSLTKAGFSDIKIFKKRLIDLFDVKLQIGSQQIVRKVMQLTELKLTIKDPKARSFSDNIFSFAEFILKEQEVRKSIQNWEKWNPDSARRESESYWQDFFKDQTDQGLSATFFSQQESLSN